MIDRNLKI